MSSKKMNKKKVKQERKNMKPYLLTAFSAVLYISSLKVLSPIIGFLMFIPFIYALHNASLKRTIGLSITLGSVFGIFAFNWMLFAGTLYSDHFIFGLLGTVVSIFIFILYFTLIFVVFWLLTRNNITIKNVFILAGLVAVMEFAFSLLFAEFPLYYLCFGMPMLGSVYTIQLAEVGGLEILSFFTILINGLIVYGLLKKRFPRWAILFLSLFIISNFILYLWRTDSTLQVGKNETSIVSFNLVNPNLRSPVDWKGRRRSLLNKMKQLNMQSAQRRADINVWPEVIFPWPYSTASQYINELLELHKGTGSYTLIGMNTKLTEKNYYNSAYLFNDKKEIVSRYDKRYLIKVLEAPVGDIIPVILNDYGMRIASGKHIQVMPTKKCQLGVFICNESTTNMAIRPLVLYGANILVNISNDSWFRGTYLIKLHFYINRMRAVTTRKDIIINSNGGVSGAVRSNADILKQELNHHSVVHKVSVVPREGKTLFVRFPFLFTIVSVLLVLLIKVFDKLNFKKMDKETKV